MKLPIGHSAEAFKPALRGQDRAIPTAGVIDPYHVLQAFERMPVGAQQILEETHFVPDHGRNVPDHGRNLPPSARPSADGQEWRGFAERTLIFVKRRNPWRKSLALAIASGA